MSALDKPTSPLDLDVFYGRPLSDFIEDPQCSHSSMFAMVLVVPDPFRGMGGAKQFHGDPAHGRTKLAFSLCK